jgi:hypothetical protein
MPSRLAPLRTLLFALLLPIPLAAAAENDAEESYSLGRGYRVGATGLRLGGYASADFALPRSAPWVFRLSDLSLFINWDQGGRLRFFSEVEVSDALTVGEHREFGTGKARFELERLYLDALLNDAATVRIGKFLTPIGRWNLIHAAPLVWTATRPLATEGLFAKNATGLMVHGSLPMGERRLDYALYADLTGTVDPHRSESPFDNALGARLLHAFGDSLEVGMSYASYDLYDEPEGRHHLLGFEGFWTRYRYELSSEWVYRIGEAGRDAYRGFVQAVAPLAGSWYGIGRYEVFLEEARKTGHIGVFGLAYRPIPPLVWKVEYRLGTRNETLAPDGLFASFAVLF